LKHSSSASLREIAFFKSGRAPKNMRFIPVVETTTDNSQRLKHHEKKEKNIAKF
jgi:hypothetical protein